MSGRLVGMIVEHGPTDRSEWAVAVVIAEDMHHPGDTALLSLDEIASRTRLSRRTVTRAVKRMIAAGRMIYTPGNGRGHASRYRLLLAELSTPLERVSEADDKGGHGDTLSDRKGGHGDRKGGHSDTPHRHRKNNNSNSTRAQVRGGARVDAAAAEMATPRTNDPAPSSMPTAEHQGSLMPVLQGGRSESSMSSSTGGEVRGGGALATLKGDLIAEFGRSWPGEHEPVALVQELLDDGWKLDQVIERLYDCMAEAAPVHKPAGFIRSVLRAGLGKPPEPKVTKLLPEWCGDCDENTRYPIDENGYLDSTRPRCACSGRSTFDPNDPRVIAAVDAMMADGWTAAAMRAG